MATREELIELLKKRKRIAALDQSMANIQADQESYKATSGMSTGEKLRAGIGTGLVGTWDRVGNLVLPKALEKGSRYSEEAIQERKKREADLTSTGAGAVGKIVGEIAATAPVGLAARGVVAGGQAALDASRGLQAASAAGGLGRGSRIAAAALEGAGSASATSDVGEGGTSALMGAGLGGAFSGLGEAIGAGLNKIRPKVTDQARQVMQETGTFIPASQALPDDSIVKQVYEGVIGNLPGGGQKLRGQYGEALEAVRDTALAGSDNVPSALPHDVPLRSIYDPSAGDTQFDMIKNAKKAWDTAFDEINQSTVTGFKVPEDIANALRTRSGGSIKIPAPGESMTGREMLDFQQAVNQLASETPRGVLDRATKGRYQKVANYVDDLMETQLRGVKDEVGADLGEKYATNKANWRHWQTVSRAAKMAPGGKFSMRQLERAAAKRGDDALQAFGENASEALKAFKSNQGIFQTAAALGLMGTTGLAGYLGVDEDESLGKKLLGATIGMGAMYGGSKLAASKAAQRILANYGDEATAKMIAKLRQIGNVGRRVATTQMTDEEDR
jgi:hypothetical protein